ncbi:hypothetical protein K438DRAFT_1992421 [Mycena galopus ATCC 62051]|nr:hypothetical protein K438DRAFT_1992421 [Mycena galopus ATCC 62051]
MSYNMRDPEERAIAMDRRAAGICPTFSSQHTLRKHRQERARELTRQRHARERTERERDSPLNTEKAAAAAVEAHLRRARVTNLDRLHAPRLACMDPPLTATQKGERVGGVSGSPARTPSHPHGINLHDAAPPAEINSSSPLRKSIPTTVTPKVRAADSIGYPAFHREPEWSEASDDDEHDPAGHLPHCPRWNISSRRARALCVIAATPTPEEIAQREVAHNQLPSPEQLRESLRAKAFLELDRAAAAETMRPVAAEILENSAAIHEYAEIGPAPHGFEYIQFE